MTDNGARQLFKSAVLPNAAHNASARPESVEVSHPRMARRRPDFVRAWIIWTAACTVLGWLLSAVGQLNASGYVAAAALGIGVYWWHWRQSAYATPRGARTNPVRLVHLVHLVNRFGRPLPLVYLVFVVLALVGGALYPPNNYDALTYRLPRMLNWWAAGHWYWISTPNDRMNYSATGSEWLMLPLLILTLTDRFLYLVNIVAYLLLPGLVFSVFHQLGAAPRVAWQWMWLIPAGYCFVMQAGGIGNDAYAAVYLLASIHYALRAARTWRIDHLWLSVLSAALLTGTKASNIPLLLPCLLATIPALPLLRKRIVTSAAIGLVALLVSFVPIAALNRTFSGEWTGDVSGHMQIRNPFVGLLGNGLQLAAQSLQPPIFPLARQVQRQLMDQLPTAMLSALERDFPRFAPDLGELPQEEAAGLGIGLTMLAILALLSPLLERTQSHDQSIQLRVARRRGLLIGVAGWVACLAYMFVLGSEATARLLATYYPLLILPLVLHPANASLARRGWWKTATIVCGATSLIPLILTPSRPLWPAATVTQALTNVAPGNAQIARINEVYAVYRWRHDLLGPLREHIPAEVRTIGLIAGSNDSELALWQPIGKRRVVDAVDGQFKTEQLSAPPTWVVIKEAALAEQHDTLSEWLERAGGKIVYHDTITSTATEGPSDWDVVELPG
jgi:hypothetical protein